MSRLGWHGFWNNYISNTNVCLRHHRSCLSALTRACLDFGFRSGVPHALQVARRAAPCVVCFDDAHVNFPSAATRTSDPGGATAIARMVVELGVQLAQLADMQAALEQGRAQQPQQQQGAATASARASNSSSSGGGGASWRSHKGGSSGGGSADGASSGLRPVWGFFSSKLKNKKSTDPSSPEQQQQLYEQQQRGAFSRMGGPVVVVFVAERPQLLDGALLGALPVQLAVELPAAEAREDLLMGWLMEREAAVNVQDVEWLARWVGR